MKHSRELGLIGVASGGFAPKGAFIAGGAITSAFSNTPINDVDFYFKSEAAFMLAIESAYDEGWWAVSATDRSVTFVQDNLTIQLIYFEYFDSPTAVFDAFDFTCVMGAYDIDAKEFAFHDNFFKHLAQRHLSFHAGTRFPFVSLLRVHKYQQRGFNIGHGDILRIALRCHQVPLNSWEDLAHAIGGHYGDRALDKAFLSEYQDGHQAFSIDNAINLLLTDGALKVVTPQSMPATWEEMVRHILELKKDPSAKYVDNLTFEENKAWQEKACKLMDIFDNL